MLHILSRPQAMRAVRAAHTHSMCTHLPALAGFTCHRPKPRAAQAAKAREAAAAEREREAQRVAAEGGQVQRAAADVEKQRAEARAAQEAAAKERTAVDALRKVRAARTGLARFAHFLAAHVHACSHYYGICICPVAPSRQTGP